MVSRRLESGQFHTLGHLAVGRGQLWYFPVHRTTPSPQLNTVTTLAPSTYWRCWVGEGSEVPDGLQMAYRLQAVSGQVCGREKFVWITHTLALSLTKGIVIDAHNVSHIHCLLIDHYQTLVMREEKGNLERGADHSRSRSRPVLCARVPC